MTSSSENVLLLKKWWKGLGTVLGLWSLDDTSILQLSIQGSKPGTSWMNNCLAAGVPSGQCVCQKTKQTPRTVLLKPCVTDHFMTSAFQQQPYRGMVLDPGTSWQKDSCKLMIIWNHQLGKPLFRATWLLNKPCLESGQDLWKSSVFKASKLLSDACGALPSEFLNW